MRRDNLKEIISKINSNIEVLRKNYNVKSIGVFGSTVRNEQTKKSDIDILVEFIKPIGFFKFIELEDFLSKILKKKVDMVSQKALKPVIKRNILEEAVYV